MKTLRSDEPVPRVRQGDVADMWVSANLLGLTIGHPLHGKVAAMTARYRYTTAGRAGKQETTRGFAVEIFVLEKDTWTYPFCHLAR